MPYSEPAIAAPSIEFFEDRRHGPFDLWWEDNSPMYDIAPVASAANTGRFEILSFSSACGAVVSATYDAQALRLTPRHSSRLADLIFVQRFVFGGIAGRSGDTPFEHRPGDVAIIDYGRPVEGLHRASQLEGIYLHKDTLGIKPETPLPLLNFPAGSIMSRLLGAEMDRVLKSLGTNRSRISVQTFERFVSCVKVAMHGTSVRCDIRMKARQALRDLICEYVERNLSSPELSTTTLLRVFGVSRATWYRMFESDSGVRNYISNRRLYRAVFDITATPMRRGHIHEISERWGFSSDANFSRAVRRAFGTSPGRLCDLSLEEFKTAPVASRRDEILQRFARIGGFERIAA